MLKLMPITLKNANAYITEKHRHHKATAGHKFSISVVDKDNTIRGVAICGRPVARLLDDGITLEVNRVCTDGAKNACSMLYGAARRAAKAMGYQRIITYTLQEEHGASLRAAGWNCEGEAGGGSWKRKNRDRADNHPLTKKIKWVCY